MNGLLKNAGELALAIRTGHNRMTSKGAMAAWMALASKKGPYRIGVLLSTLMICAWTDSPPQESTKEAAATLKIRGMELAVAPASLAPRVTSNNPPTRLCDRDGGKPAS